MAYKKIILCSLLAMAAIAGLEGCSHDSSTGDGGGGEAPAANCDSIVQSALALSGSDEDTVARKVAEIAVTSSSANVDTMIRCLDGRLTIHCDRDTECVISEK